ncbi:hypothetical protein D3C77_233140 [compost metagenome]
MKLYRYDMKKFFAIAVIACLQGCATPQHLNRQAPIAVDPYTTAKLDDIFSRAQAKPTTQVIAPGVEEISSALMDTPYQADTLIGSVTVPEQLVVDLRHLDCFTFIDNVEALRRSSNNQEYIKQLIKVRYAQGKVDFSHRRHFFTDWAQDRDAQAQDVTSDLGSVTKIVEKDLNIKADGTPFIPGLSGVSRRIAYIPGPVFNSETIKNIKDGDYIGVYSDLPGLDVSHVGVFIRTANGPVFRNASSRSMNRKVVDYPFVEFVAKVPGIVVLRPR